eukprot:CCRYP_018713-RA/>CCRYP_018713-RA protein AED:0.26 eAED:0.55 QI:47/0/0/1/0/0/2/0/92
MERIKISEPSSHLLLSSKETSLFLELAHANMENVLPEKDDSNLYIEDVRAFSTSWECHLEPLSCFLLFFVASMTMGSLSDILSVIGPSKKQT